MSARKIATAAVLLASAAAPLVTVGAGTASAASSTAYCYRNANNDNGTRIELSGLRVFNGNRFVANTELERWNGRVYVGDGLVRDLDFFGPQIPGNPRSDQEVINGLCSIITSRAGFSGYNIGQYA